MTCLLCNETGGELVWQDALCRVVRVADVDHPAFFRVILQDHVAEMSDLSAADARQLMACVFTVERVLRAALQPAKINLASLGNMVPHLHWHVIARFVDDAHFPNPVWGERLRSSSPRTIDIPALNLALVAALNAGDPQ